jgi:uncharacterized membrane protein
MPSMMPSFGKPSSVSPSTESALPGRTRIVVQRLGSGLALVAVAVWMGGLVALGALAAPVIFARVPLPTSADAMTVVFRRFDTVAMACASAVLATEAVRAALRMPFQRFDHARAFVSAAAAVVAVFEGIHVSPQIAHLHAQGVLRGLGGAGLELSRLHDLAELCGQVELGLLVVVIALHVVTLSSVPAHGPAPARDSSEGSADGAHRDPAREGPGPRR